MTLGIFLIPSMLSACIDQIGLYATYIVAVRHISIHRTYFSLNDALVDDCSERKRAHQSGCC